MTEAAGADGRHLIDGVWVAGEQTFTADRLDGQTLRYASGTAADIDRAAQAAEAAFGVYGWSDRQARAEFLDAIADAIEHRAEAITAVATAETGLPAARIEGERGRTTGQLRLFARHIRDGAYLDRRHDAADPGRKPLPRPEIRLVQRPIGPVGVFGASNFPLAFSTAGGDTASALAAGCPVVVKGHPAHPGTSQIVAEAVLEAIQTTGQHPGVFSLIQSNTNEAGEALVKHPLIKAIGFTGSLRGGRALFDLAVSRPEPIPFFGELGSVNPFFVLPQAARERAGDIARGWAASLTMGAGQFCTNPGLCILIEGETADLFVEEATAAIAGMPAQTMLSAGIATAFRRGAEHMAASNAVRTLHKPSVDGRSATPGLFQVEGRSFLADRDLGEEVFGPAGLIVTVGNENEMLELAGAAQGQLTATLHMEAEDAGLASRLLPVLERKAGRILVNGYPTGVEVVDAMMHGGPYPASTNVATTSVGTLAIRRFLRPVAYQNLPVGLLPKDLQS
jgi:alpha-ketoglutaric semialdehyde dehydrogenase